MIEFMNIVEQWIVNNYPSPKPQASSLLAGFPEDATEHTTVALIIVVVWFLIALLFYYSKR